MCLGCATTVVCRRSAAAVPNPADPAAPLENPWGVDRLRLAAEIGSNVGGYLLLLPMAAAVVAILLRVRSVAGVERQQLRWVASGAAMAIIGVFVFPLAEVFGWSSPS
jgi:hypothetical protein